MEFTDLLCHGGKVTSDKKIILYLIKGETDGNRAYCSCFSSIFKTTSKFPIVFVKLILAKKGIDEVTGTRQKIDSYQLDLNVILKGLGANRDSYSRFWFNFESTIKFPTFFV